MDGKADKEDIAYCYCTLVLGKKYYRIGKAFLQTYVENVPGIKIVVVTDSEEELVTHEQVITIPFRENIPGHFISHKWLAYKEALNLGFSTVCYIDADSIAKPEFNNEQITNSIRDGLGCNWFLSYNKKSNFRTRGAKKLQNLMKPGDKYPVICPVECFMFLHGDKDRSLEFISEWEDICREIVDKRMFHREVCHEIGLAAKRVGLPVYKYPGGRRPYLDNFSHFGNWGAKRKMLEQYG